jgi:prophage tail gpP-like protein
MPNETVSMLIDDTQYTGWTELSIKRSLTSLCGSFGFSMADVWGINNQLIALRPGLSVRIYIGDEQVMSGWMDSVAPSLASSAHGIRVSGRDRTCDLVDCSAMNVPGIWRNRTLKQIVQDLIEPFAIELVDEVNDTTKFSTFKLNVGETVFEAASRAAAKRATLLITDANGRMVIANTSSQLADDGLKQGGNILAASASFNDSERYSRYIVRGQQATQGEGWGASTVTIKGEGEDEAITRNRPIIIKADGAVTTKDAQNQARWNAHVRAGKAQDVRAMVRGFHQSSGALWALNRITNVDIPLLLVGNSMLITSVEFVKGNAGSVTNMELQLPNAFVAQPPKKVQPARDVGW